MASQGIVTFNPLQPPVVDVEHTPLADKDFRISDHVIEFNLLELHCWSHDKSIDQADEVFLWESNFPKYIVPQTFQCREVIRICQTCYFPDQRAIITPGKEILFTIIAKSINQMLLVQPRPDETPSSIETLTKLYLKLDFPKRF